METSCPCGRSHEHEFGPQRSSLFFRSGVMKVRKHPKHTATRSRTKSQPGGQSDAETPTAGLLAGWHHFVNGCVSCRMLTLADN